MSAIGPELPPHLLTRSKGGSPSDGDDQPATVGPQIPVAGPSLTQPAEDETNQGDSDSDDDYAPALPPDLLASRSGLGLTTKVAFPQPYSKGQNHDRSKYGVDPDEEDSDDDVGPMPLPDGISFEEENGVREFMEREERRRKQIEVRVLIILCCVYLTQRSLLLRKLRNQKH